MSSKKKLLKKMQLGLIDLPWAERQEALSEVTPAVTPVVAFREEFSVVEVPPVHPVKKVKKTSTRKKSKKSN